MPIRKKWTIDRKGYHALGEYASTSSKSALTEDEVGSDLIKGDQEYDVELKSCKWIPGNGGFQFNKQCKIQIIGKFLKPTSVKKVIIDTFVIYDGDEEDLGQQVEAYLDEDGIAEAEVVLYYGEAYANALTDNPEAKCSYKFRASNRKCKKDIESDLLDLPIDMILEVDVVEVPDIIFNINSAIPCIDEKGWFLEAVVTALAFAHYEKEKELVVFGHTDRSDDNDYNFDLSELRALTFKAILANDTERWLKSVEEKSKVEDYQRILKTFTNVHGWNCDPGNVDDVNGPKTKTGVENFQRDYNQKFKDDIDKGKKEKLNDDGIIGPKTWTAIFHVYQYYLEIALAGEIGKHTIPPLIWGYKSEGIFPCGECLPKTSNFAYYSQTDRRIELIFYDKGEISGNLTAPGANNTYDHEHCPITKYMWTQKKIDLAKLKPQPKIKIEKCDTHFAPKKEELEITYKTEACGNEDFFIEITSETYTHNPVFKRPLENNEKSDGQHTIKWDGKTTCPDGDLKDSYINPLFAPYKVKIYKDPTIISEAEFHVYYHSISLSIGSYTADSNEPDKNAELIKWIQYKLNENGYFAGPVNGTKNDQTKRAMKRYSYVIPNLMETDDENNASLQTHLQNNDSKRTIIEGNTLPKKGEICKIYIENDYFYEDYNAEYLAVQGHGNKQSDKLDRFELPLEMKILLVSKADNNATEPGIDAPEGVGKAEIEWIMNDPLEDTSIIPDPTNDNPCHAKSYVETTLNALGQNNSTPENARDNCPKSSFGERGTNKDYFLTGTDLPPFSSTVNGDRVISTVHTDVSSGTQKIGLTGIICQMSYIAGDNYAITARLSFDNNAHKDTLIQAHETFTGKEIDEILLTETGIMTLWRKQHISSEINWPAPSHTVQWSAIADAYKVAAIDLDTSPIKKSIQNFFNDHDKAQYANIVKQFFLGSNKFTSAERNASAFDENGMYPFPIPAQGEDKPKKYKKRLRKKTEDFADPNLLMLIGQYIRLVNNRDKGPGAISINTHFIRTVKVKHSFLFIKWEKEYTPPLFCCGLNSGVAIFDNRYLKDFQEGFLLSHELAHCWFLWHHEVDGKGNSERPKDHDLNDHNCIMCYPQGIQSRNVTWKKDDNAYPTFCGKCVLKLRGWKVADSGLPAQS